MASPRLNLPWGKGLLIVAGALVCFYALIVLWVVHSAPDIGLRTAFDSQVRGFAGQCLPIEAAPEPGDRVLSVGAKQIETWAQLLRSVQGLRDEIPEPVEALPADGDQQTYVQLNGHNLVRLTFRRQADGSVQTCWCRVDKPFDELVLPISWFFLKLGLFLVGALVFWKRPTDPSARQFFLLCIVTLGAYMGGYHWSRIATYRELILVFMVCSVMLPAVLLHFYTVFPRPKGFVERSPWATLAGIYGLPLAFLGLMAATYFHVRWMDRNGFSAAAVNEGLNVLLLEIYVYLGVAAAWYLASVACLVHSYRAASDATERNQVKWILFGSLAAFVPIGWTLYLAALRRNDFGAGAATWPMFLASVCFTVAFVISITRYRLMQLDLIITSGVVYFIISFLAVVVYYAVVFASVLLVGSWSGSLLSQTLSVSTSALVLMLLLDVARSRLKKVLDRRLHREKTQIDRTLRLMGQAIDQLVDPPTLARQLLQALAEVLGVGRGSVYLREGEPPLYRLVECLGPTPALAELSLGCPLIEAIQRRAAVVGLSGRETNTDPVQRQLRFLGGAAAHALAHEGELLALLVLGPKEQGAYSSEDLNLLAAFCQLTALALKSAERHRTIEGLNRELHTKIEKISEQQRRILALQSQLTRQIKPAEPITPVPIVSTGGIIGSGPIVEQLLQMVKKVSASQSAVLIRGESGTGKELLARAVHENSPRAGKRFVKVHCAALSPGLLESELFGHVKGAFTDAHRDKVGRFELADSGTLFLDEIGDISLEVQTKLLRVLQEMVFERVGSSEPVKVNVRIIAATHQNLEKLIEQGRFREDLYYRLNVISISVPPLRERPEDIPELAAHFMKLNAQRCGKSPLTIDDDALSALKAYSWPGNIRQLENVLERAVVVAEGSTITVDELPGDLFTRMEPFPDMAPAWPNGNHKPLPGAAGIHAERDERDRRERERLVRALAAAQGNKAEAARALGLARSTLLSRLKKYGLN
jgi:transcriptional regulator with GAF, ATPase, and Fis domain